MPLAVSFDILLVRKVFSMYDQMDISSVSYLTLSEFELNVEWINPPPLLVIMVQSGFASSEPSTA